MNYEYLWNVLEELIVELRSKGVVIHRELINDLKSAQTFINIYRSEPTALDIATEIELYLEKVEANLMYLAESDISDEYAQNCLKRISEARMMGLQEKATVKPRIVYGVPKDEHWIRIEVNNLLGGEELNALIKKFNLSSKPQENGYILIHGKKDNVKALIKTIKKKIGKKKNK